jgi:ribosomal protein S18 acetylase RimI-like enzyme
MRKAAMTTIREAKTVDDALAILPIRNDARHFMTRHTEVISTDQQREWWNNNHGTYALYLVELLERPIGYGLIRFDNDPEHLYASVSAAIVPELRGRGYGFLIFSFLTCEVRIRKKVPWLEVLATNAAARALYRKLGYVDTETRKEVVVAHEVVTMMHAAK